MPGPQSSQTVRLVNILRDGLIPHAGQASVPAGLYFIGPANWAVPGWLDRG